MQKYNVKKNPLKKFIKKKTKILLRYYNSIITKSQVSTQAKKKYHLFRNPHMKKLDLLLLLLLLLLPPPSGLAW